MHESNSFKPPQLAESYFDVRLCETFVRSFMTFQTSQISFTKSCSWLYCQLACVGGGRFVTMAATCQRSHSQMFAYLDMSRADITKAAAPSNMLYFDYCFHYLWLFVRESHLLTVYSAQKDGKEPA